MTRYVIGCDVGSQGTNAALYADDGAFVKQLYHQYDLSYPAPGWAEQDPSDWLAAVTATVGALSGSVPFGSIAAISFGTQLDGMVVCDERCRPLRPAMIWMDRRAEAQAARLAERLDPAEFYRLSGVNLDSSHAAFKALWVRDNQPDLYASARWMLSPGAWVLHGVTGIIAVDPSNASSTGLLDPRTRQWSMPLLDATGIDGERLAEVRPAPEAVGTVTAAFAAAAGLSPDTIVATGCGDEMAATLGAGVFEPGEVCDVVGTAEPVCAVSAAPREDPTRLVECHPHADPATWLLENPGFVSGGNLRWWRDGFGTKEREREAAGDGDAYDLLCRDAAAVPPGADGLTFLPCMQGAMAPEWNGAARGAFAGLSLAHTRAHMTRAILEGSAFALRDILEAMHAAGLDVRRITMVGGGARGALWRRIKADVTGLPVRVPTNVETTATGAAILAAVAAGLYPDCAEAAKAFVTYEPVEDLPDQGARPAYDEAHRRYREVYFGLRPVYGSPG
jgi:xylulokinase